jgi:hypothetical protein
MKRYMSSIVFYDTIAEAESKYVGGTDVLERHKDGSAAIVTLTIKPVQPGQEEYVGSGGAVPKWTIKTAKAELAKFGLVLSHNDGEYRVNKKGGREATAAYTNDLDDAVGTGIAMANKGAW